ncbi:MAG: cation:proton antiporter [Herpetosiphon sp.]|nr:cation:proton antiporter [Herpetosiphon sp.]
MHELPLLLNLTAALLTAFIGGLIARRVGLPPIVGYLLAGMAIGPFTPGFVGDIVSISQLAELGVIFLMFGVGLHFSLGDLWTVRAVAIPGAILRIVVMTLLGYALARWWGWSSAAGWVLGFAISIASTVVLLRNLTDQGVLNTIHGQVSVGWLVLEDLATIVILVLMPALFGGDEQTSWQSAALSLFKAAAFVGIMLVIGKRALPWLLTQITFTRSRELFILAVVAVALGVAIGSAKLFGVSLALGAFLAGLVLGESAISHQIGAEVVAFRDVFTVIFFVSVGMLVNPVYLWSNAAHVLILTILIVVGKSLLTFGAGLFLPASARTMLLAAAGAGQIGEFSFIVGQAGMALGVLNQDQYSLILAGALISIVLNPLLFRLVPWAERTLPRFATLWRYLNRQNPHLEVAKPMLDNHVVIVGAGRVGEHVVTVLEQLKTPRLVMEIDPQRTLAFNQRGIPTLFGDAANSEILTHAGLERAQALVVTLPDEAATEMVVAAARDLAPTVPIIARASTRDGVERLHKLGAGDVIHPEFEGGLEVVRHTLLKLGYPLVQVEQYTDAVRRDAYNTAITSPAEQTMIDQLITAVRGLDMVWRTVSPQSSLHNQSLAEADLRAKTGASVIAIIRDQHVIANPKSATVFQHGDQIGLIGDKTQIAAFDTMFGS